MIAKLGVLNNVTSEAVASIWHLPENLSIRHWPQRLNVRRFQPVTASTNTEEMTTPRIQTAVIQSKASPRPSGLPLAITSSKAVPELSSPYHVAVRVLAVGLNPTDYKMITHFFMDGNTVGCDFCGIVESAGESALVSTGDRVCGADFPYRPDNKLNGAFAQYAVTDSRHVLRVPKNWSDTQAAALGAIGWCTACLAISDPAALNLKGMPSRPTEKPSPVLVYGGATATGLMAIQMLNLLVEPHADDAKYSVTGTD